MSFWGVERNTYTDTCVNFDTDTDIITDTGMELTTDPDTRRILEDSYQFLIRTDDTHFVNRKCASII